MNKYRKNMYFGNNDANKSGTSMIFYKFITSIGSCVFTAVANVPKDGILFFPTPGVTDIYLARFSAQEPKNFVIYSLHLLIVTVT